MDIMEIAGGEPLFGEVNIQGSKNAVLPILSGTLLVPGETIIHNCPKILDVYYSIEILQSIGCLVTWKDDVLRIDSSFVSSTEIPETLAGKMRSSIIFMGAMLGRKKCVSLPYPGGCVIGKRPVDLHLRALRQMGVTITEEPEKMEARVLRLTGCDITLSFPSVGACENIILAAVLAEGITVIHNAAREPEIVTLCRFLQSAGADIHGAGESEISICGVKELKPVDVFIPSDRIVAGTYGIAIAATRGCAILKNAPVREMQSVIDNLRKAGCRIAAEAGELFIDATDADEGIPHLSTGVYPDFPTDLQSPFLVYLCMAKGTSILSETVFENRFRIVEELKKMGAVIETEGSDAHIYGIERLHGASVYANELRGCAALAIAGLCAMGTTIVQGAGYADRGYEDLCRDLRALGAKIVR